MSPGTSSLGVFVSSIDREMATPTFGFTLAQCSCCSRRNSGLRRRGQIFTGLVQMGAIVFLYRVLVTGLHPV